MVQIETFPEPILKAFYETFEKIAPIRVLMKIAKPELLPKGLPKNVMTQSWLQQMKVLSEIFFFFFYKINHFHIIPIRFRFAEHKNIKAFITHGGLGSMLESLSAGVPLIGIPLFGDQFLVIESQVRRKIAIRIDLDKIDVKTLHSAIREIFDDPIYEYVFFFFFIFSTD